MSACGVICHCRCWEATANQGGLVVDYGPSDDDYRDDPELKYACCICGEPEGSVYAKQCCSTDNMIEV